MKLKIRRVMVSPHVLKSMLTVGEGWKVTHGIPKGAELRGFTMDPYTNSLILFIEHESFDPIEEGTVAPLLEAEMVRVL